MQFYYISIEIFKDCSLKAHVDFIVLLLKFEMRCKDSMENDGHLVLIAWITKIL